ncbi:hypothetical protein QN374_16900, partial [Herbaspirillum sp. RTI4]|nr:hypothetical protein [Herbaspirillum sp. RTI4]
IGYSFIFIFSYLIPTDYEKCDEFTYKLNGGIHQFNGKKYNIKLCGTPTFNSSNEIRMQILDEKAKVLAQRYFILRFNDASPRELIYTDEGILYHDHVSDEPLSMVSMPPTPWDWIKAKLPLFN